MRCPEFHVSHFRSATSGSQPYDLSVVRPGWPALANGGNISGANSSIADHSRESRRSQRRRVLRHRQQRSPHERDERNRQFGPFDKRSGGGDSADQYLRQLWRDCYIHGGSPTGTAPFNLSMAWGTQWAIINPGPSGTGSFYSIVTNLGGTVTNCGLGDFKRFMLGQWQLFGDGGQRPRKCDQHQWGSGWVKDPLLLSRSPLASLLSLNGTATVFSVTAAGSGTLSYQWLSNGISMTDGGGHFRVEQLLLDDDFTVPPRRIQPITR